MHPTAEMKKDFGKVAEKVSSSFAGPAWALETCHCWEGPGLFTLSSEKVNSKEGESEVGSQSWTGY